MVASISFGQVSINEIDSDQTGTDMTEFVEFLSDNPSQSLDGYFLVFFIGNNAVNGSYILIDLNCFTTDVPTSDVHVSGIITERNNGDYFITARNMADIDENLSVESNTINGLSVYPNPANDFVTISTNINAEKAVVIFDITGKTVINTTTMDTVHVGTLASGVYIMQITENDAVATTKLIIK